MKGPSLEDTLDGLLSFLPFKCCVLKLGYGSGSGRGRLIALLQSTVKIYVLLMSISCKSTDCRLCMPCMHQAIWFGIVWYVVEYTFQFVLS